MSLPILSALSPSWVTLKLPTGVGWPGCWAASGGLSASMICAPGAEDDAVRLREAPLPAFPAV